MWNSEIAVFQRYMGSGLMLLWFVMALVYLYYKEEKKINRILFLYVPTLILLLFFNPLFVRFFYEFAGDDIYFRICWLLPVTIVLAYSILQIYQSLQEKKRKPFLAIVFVLIAVSGAPVYQNPLYSRAENIYHVPQTVVDICDAIIIPGREVMALFPAEHLLYVRQYTPYVCMPYGRDYLQGWWSELGDVVNSDEIDVAKMAPLAKEKGCHYVIISEKKLLIGDMSNFDYELFARIDRYLVYKDVTMNFDV